MPKVSIICRTYNQENWIEQAIESALSQTFGDFELIIVDDASSDLTPVKIKHFSDPRIKSIKHPLQLGHLESLNRGILEAKGEYICILDGDDAFMPHKLEKQVSFLEQHPEYGAVYTHIETMGEQNNSNVQELCELFKTMINKPQRTKAQMFKECFGTGTFLAFASGMFRKEYAFHFPNHLLALGETNFHLSMLLKTNIMVIEEPLLQYRVMANYTNKWANPIGLQSELYFILDRFLEIESMDLFKEIFKTELKNLHTPLEKGLLPVLLTQIAEKEAGKMHWANYNFHRFISVSTNYNVLKETLHLTYAQFSKLKRGPLLDNASPIKLQKKVKKYKRLFYLMLVVSIAFIIINLMALG
jgi:glycosyltransferase involved in cell wall biosynthesis